MSILLDSLRSSATRLSKRRYRSLNEAKAHGVKSGFLCHSHKDAEYAEGFAQQLAEGGLELYIDWEDDTMPEHPDHQTALVIQKKIPGIRSIYFPRHSLFGRLSLVSVGDWIRGWKEDNRPTSGCPDA